MKLSTSKFVRSLLLVTTVLAVSACSKGPSDGQIEKAVENAYQMGNCKYISLENFKKVNGIAQGEQYYDVAVSFTFEVEAVPELNKLNELESQLEQVELDEQMSKNDLKAAERKAMLAAMPVSTKGHEHDATYGKETNEEREAAIIELKKLEAEIIELRKKVDNLALNDKLKPKLIEDIKVLSDKYEGCRIPITMVGIDPDKGGSKQMNWEFRMIKTDNGWMKAR